MSQQIDKKILVLYRNPGKQEAALRLLMDTYQERLYWHIRRMVDSHDDTDDILQNVFVKVWKGLDRFREDSQMYTWLYRIATNETITFLNKQKKRATVPLVLTNEEGDYVPVQLQSSEHVLDAEETLHKLKQAIESLPAKQKQVFVMRYYDEMRYEAISEILETSVGALKASYHHAVKKIENFLTAD